jgi:hypothetical protein
MQVRRRFGLSRVEPVSGFEPLAVRLQVGPLQAARAAPAGIALPALRSYGIRWPKCGGEVRRVDVLRVTDIGN